MSVSPHGSDELRETMRKIEAILFAAPDGAALNELTASSGATFSEVRKAIAALKEEYKGTHGLEIVELGGKWFMTTAPDLAETLDKFHSVDESVRVRLTRAAMETLAIIAYSQPVTRSEIEEIRGVRCDRVIDTLLGYGLVRIAGRRKAVGSPLLYRTTTRFLEVFGLGAISDLPTVAELQELKREREDDGFSVAGDEAPQEKADERRGETDPQ